MNSALYMLRADVRALRVRGRRQGVAAANARALARLSAPFSAWLREAKEGRHAQRLRGQVDQVSSHSTMAIASLRAEVRQLRVRGRGLAVDRLQASMTAKLAAPFSAWAREVA